MRDRWQEYFLDLCGVSAEMSKDPSTQVGALVVRPDRTIAGMGWNGFPMGCNDDERLYLNRDTKYSRTIHAEMNAILHLRERPRGYTLYCSCAVCDRCMAHIAQVGIIKVVTPPPTADYLSRWAKSYEMALEIADDAGITVVTCDWWTP